MTAIDTPAFTAARVQGRYRVLDEAGQIVVTLNSKAKAEARAAELNEAAAIVEQSDNLAEIDAALDTLDGATVSLAQIEADVAMEQAMDEECPQEEFVAPTTADLPPLPMDAPLTEEERAFIAEQDEKLAALDREQEPAQERQEAPAQGAGSVDTPAQEEGPQSDAQPVAEVKGKTGPNPHTGKAQPAPHAFTTVGTKVPNHCAECGRSWAAAAHRKFREAQAEAPSVEAAEAEWTPAPDDTTDTGKAPAEG